MVTVEGNRGGTALYLWASFAVLHLASFQIRVPDYQTVEPLLLDDPVYAPEVPYLGTLSEHLSIGSVIQVEGYIPQNTRQFQFSLCGADCSTGPLHLRIDVRFDENVVVRNSYEGYQWKIEERNGGVHFADHEAFVLLIEVRATNYSITVNDDEVWSFTHRIPFSTVEKFEIRGEPIKIWKIEYTSVADKIYTPDYQTIAPLQLNVPVYVPEVPYLSTLSEQLRIGSVIRVQGYIPPNTTDFQINLCADCSDGPIHLHIDVRFHKQVVVRNSYEDNQWKTEDRCGGVPFAVNQDFVLLIEVRAEDYRITVNGDDVWTFAHRVPYSTVEKLEIKGEPIAIWKIEYADVTSQQETQCHQVNDDITKGMTIHINGNPPNAFEKFTLNLNFDSTPQSSSPKQSTPN